jgi:hypothetical protein
VSDAPISSFFERLPVELRPGVSAMAQRVRKAAQAKLYFGKYRGTVVANNDPERQGRLKVRVPEVLGQGTTKWAVPCVPYAGKRAGFYAVPSAGTTVFVEFEAGDLARPVWTGALWDGTAVPADERGASVTPAVKVLRSEQGLLLALHDDQKRIALADSIGANVLTIEVQRSVVTIKAAQKVVVDAPIVELSANARHPGVHGDSLLVYLNAIVAMFNTHIHPGQTAGSTPVTPAPPVPPLPPATPDLLSFMVKLG